MAFSFPPPSQLEPLLPDMEDDDEEKEGSWCWLSRNPSGSTKQQLSTSGYLGDSRCWISTTVLQGLLDPFLGKLEPLFTTKECLQHVESHIHVSQYVSIIYYNE